MPTIRPYDSRRCRIALFPLLAALAFAPLAMAQSTPQTQPPPPEPQQTPPTQQPDQTAPGAGGPIGDNGAIAVPKKKDKSDDTPPPALAQPKFKNPEGAGDYSLRVDVPKVTVDVGVLLETTGQFVPGLNPSNFKLYENGVKQKVTGFKRVEAPITALMLCEFSNSNFTYSFLRDQRNAAWEFAQQLRPQDYVALMTFDMRTQILLDFTPDITIFAISTGGAVRAMTEGGPGFNQRTSLDRNKTRSFRFTSV
jgi:hypothetical protein